MADPLSSLPRSRLARRLAVLAALFLAGFAVAFAGYSWSLERERESNYLASIAELGGRSINAYFARIELDLTELSEQLADRSGVVDPARARAILRRHLRSHRELSNLKVVRADGYVLVSAEDGVPLGIPATGVSPSFERAREALRGGQAMDLGLPMVDRSTGNWAIPMRVPVVRPGAEPYILTATLPLSRQQTFWVNLPLPESTVLGLMRDDGYLLSRYPVPGSVDLDNVYGKPRQGGLRAVLQATGFPLRGVTEGRTSLTGFNNIFAYHRLDRYPVTLFVALPIPVLTSKWWKQSQPFFLLVIAFIVSGYGAYSWARKRERVHEHERARIEAQRRLAASAMESTMEGILVTDREGRVVAVNPAFTSITGYAAEEIVGRKPDLLKSGRHDQAFYEQLWRELTGTGTWKGEIWNRRKDGELYPELLSISAVRAPDGTLSHYVGVFTDISRFKDYEARLEFLANHDPLTGLPNRTLLHDRLEEALARAARTGGRVCVMFIDLDRFKMVNDSLGHAVGDRLLQAVARLLQVRLRESDTLARLGGDEFTVIAEGLRNTEEAALIAQKLLDALSAPLVIDDRQLFVSASVGISFSPHDGRDVQTLLKHADTAMYRAKDDGRNRYRFFSSDMNLRAQEFMLMANNLHAALEQQQFFLEYQPRIELNSGRILGAEALIRWRHPELGLVAPERFIPIAEETGLIVPIGTWVLRTAAREARAWLELAPELRLSVNLSPRQFRAAGLVGQILAVLHETGFDPRQLDVEITETLMMHDPEVARETLQELRRAGVRAAIDDFGIGYSSLRYLKDFPVHYLKIDRSFVRDVPSDAQSAAIVRAIAAMANRLGLGLIAEGIEDAAQLNFLAAEGCEEAQGFYFSRPVPAEAFAQLLRAAPTREPAAPRRARRASNRGRGSGARS